MISKNSCPICKSSSVDPFLERAKVPVLQNFIIPNQKLAKNVPKGELKLVVCNDCGFIFNQTFDLLKLNYGEKYDNTQDISSYFYEYTTNLVRDLVFKKNVKNCSIVEIGCGKGSFLRRLVEPKKWENRGYGFDLSYVGPKTDFSGRLNFERRFYDTDCAIDADVIICRHVIEHVPDPLKLLSTIRQSLKNSEQTQIFFETPTVDWILQNKVIYDFFYEHCSYFNANSLATAFELAGFKVNVVKTIFKGQYLWLEAAPSTKKQKIRKIPGITSNLTKDFSVIEKKIIDNWKKRICELTKKGKVAIWGGGAKGVTFCNLIDPECKLIDSVIDLNPNKHGKYVSGTGHPIIDYSEITARKITSAILMNPNYYDENKILLQKSSQTIDLVQ